MMNTLNNLTNINVLIAIQARSGSTRFPGKIFEMIGKKCVLQHVIDAAKSSKFHVERKSSKKISPIKCEVAILHPENDKDLMLAFKQSGAMLIGGDEVNVLSRFLKAFDMLKPDYVVRLTSDCPLSLPYMISKHILTAVHNKLDYISNVHESCRMVADGFDVEVMSAKAMNWLRDNVKFPEDQEHVTIKIRKAMPSDLLIGYIAKAEDSSNLKLSVDTPQDLDNIRTYYHNREFKMNTARNIFGANLIYDL